MHQKSVEYLFFQIFDYQFFKNLILLWLKKILSALHEDWGFKNADMDQSE